MMLRWFLLFLCLSAQGLYAQADPVVAAELEQTDLIVGQPITLRLKVLVPTWMPSPPDFPSPEVPGLLVRLPERASGPISESIEGETWSGVQRAYRLHPLQVGQFELPPMTVTVRYAEPGSPDPILFEADLGAITFTAVAPDGLSPLIVAEDFALEQTLDQIQELDVGDAIERTVTARISGTTPILIPSLTPIAEDPALRAYPKEPRVTETEDRGILSG